MRKDSIGVLVSGGLDSDVLLAEMAGKFKRVVPVYVRQGLVWENVELYWLKRFLNELSSGNDSVVRPLCVLKLPIGDVYRKHWSLGKGPMPGARSADKAVYLPGRNLVLTVKAGVLCAMLKIPNLALGSLDHNPFPDASLRFFKAWGAAMSLGLGTEIRILAPYRSLSKTEVIRRGKTLPLHLSFSCLAPKGKNHCGVCNKCAERQRAFQEADVMDKTMYSVVIPRSRQRGIHQGVRR